MANRTAKTETAAKPAETKAPANYCIRFSAEIEAMVAECMEMAGEIWAEAEAKIDHIRIMAGNYSGYGAYLARAWPNGIIEFPIGNSFSLINVRGNELVLSMGAERFKGTLLHEIGHQIVNNAKRRPWTKSPKAGSSTHTCREWIWICRAGWAHVHGEENTPTVAEIAAAVKAGHRGAINALVHFSPFRTPPNVWQQYGPVAPNAKCTGCGEHFHAKRKTAKFCGTKCRVAAHRAK